MGFFDRLRKALFGKKDPEVVEPAEERPYVSPALFTQPAVTVVVPTVPDVYHQLSEQSISGGATAVAIPSLFSTPAPLVASSATQVALLDEPSEADPFADDFDQDLDDAFALLVSHDEAAEPASSSGEMISNDQLVVADLFADIASNYARPVKNFIFELKRGTATREWIEICRPAMRGITRAAEGMGLSVAAQRMVDFEAALLLAQGSQQRVLGGEIRNLLLWCYEDLAKAMPQAFVVGEEEQKREGIIINSLLMQIPGMGRVSVEKLYSAGLTSLDTLFLAKGEELRVATGIPSLLSERICEKFQAYRAELEGQSRDLADSGRRLRVGEMLADLRHQHDSFQRACQNEWNDPSLAAEKREYRRQRQSCLLQINVLLAEIGELELVNELQKLSFDRRIRRLEQFLASPAATI